ncbi:D-alanine--D-alanine ligase [Alkaliphilus transvaalensis]|uniref:D-alanine--D-alanine ligase n=1 Tax=Alkaliphilus transvaalensis TaxID=114628 RepID=UPI00047A19C6|nr:D-alanine--D-alanine ligase [Alkaliphilus transvaalensis]
MEKINVMVVFGGKSGEHEVSLMSAASILRAIDKEKYNVIPVGITKNGGWRICDCTIDEIENGSWENEQNQLLDTKLNSKPKISLLPSEKGKGFQIENSQVKKIDVVFPVLHGPFGEDGTIQGLIEMLDVPYVGAGVLASALAMDKGMAKKILEAEGLPQAKYILINRKNYFKDKIDCINLIEGTFNYPVFVKPANLGSSVGISKAKNQEELKLALEEAAKYDRRIVVEEFINAREIECSVLGNEDPIASLPAEIIPSKEFYDYRDKYFDGTSQYVIPAELSEEMISKVREMAIRVYKLIDCSGLARVDFFVEGETNRILVNEVNTMPGFTKISMYPKMWEVSGIPYDQLIDKLIQLAIERYKDRN